jgi:TPR repeat protein
MKKMIIVLLLLITGRSFAQNTTTKVDATIEFNNALDAAHKGDYETCLEWFTKAAAKGDAEAMHRIGLLYEYSGLLKSGKNQALAIEWLKKAAKAGFEAAGVELDRYQREQNLVSLADWKTIHEGHVNAGKDYWVKVIEWSMIGDGRYYTIGASKYDKRGKELVPFAAAITYQVIDEKGKVVKQFRSVGNDYSITFSPTKDGKYTIQAYYDMNDCVGCRSADKPGAFKMQFSIAMYNYTPRQ